MIKIIIAFLILKTLKIIIALTPKEK